MQAAGIDVSMCNLVVSRQCITPGTEGVYTAGCLVGCFPRLSGDAERKRSGVGVDSEKERRSPIARAFRSCYDRILFDSELRADSIEKACHFSALDLNRYPVLICRYGRTFNVEAYDNNITRIVDIEICDVGSVFGGRVR